LLPRSALGLAVLSPTRQHVARNVLHRYQEGMSKQFIATTDGIVALTHGQPVNFIPITATGCWCPA